MRDPNSVSRVRIDSFDAAKKCRVFLKGQRNNRLLAELFGQFHMLWVKTRRSSADAAKQTNPNYIVSPSNY